MKNKYKTICLSAIFSFTLFAEDRPIYVAPDDVSNQKYSSFYIGFDVKNKIRVDNDTGTSENGLTIGYERQSGNNSAIGAEYVLPFITNEDSGAGEELDILTFYWQQQSRLDYNTTAFLRLGYNFFPNYDDGGAAEILLDYYGIYADIKVKGGICYGVGIKLKKLQFSYTIHQGTVDVSAFYDGNWESNSTKIKQTRLNMSVLIF